MKKILFPVVILVLVFGGIALVSSTRKGPRLYIGEKTIDFGIQDVQEKLERPVIIKNTGSEALIISKIESDCGCTAALLSEKTILPGERGKLLVTVDTWGMRGDFAKHVTIHSNDPEATAFTLTVSGTITLIFAVDRLDLDFHEVPAGKGAAATLTFQRVTEERVGITEVLTGSKFLHVEKVHSPDGILTFVRVALDAGTPAGEFRDSLRVKTSSKIRSEFNIPVKAKILP